MRRRTRRSTRSRRTRSSSRRMWRTRRWKSRTRRTRRRTSMRKRWRRMTRTRRRILIVRVGGEGREGGRQLTASIFLSFLFTFICSGNFQFYFWAFHLLDPDPDPKHWYSDKRTYYYCVVLYRKTGATLFLLEPNKTGAGAAPASWLAGAGSTVKMEGLYSIDNICIL